MPIPFEIVAQVVTWKNPEVRAYSVAFIKAGLEYLNIGIHYFGSDSVAEVHQPEDHAVPGAAISLLLGAGVIKGFYDTIPDDKIYGGRRTSRRPLANGRKINLFSLASRSIAESFLKRNNIYIQVEQLDLFANG